MRANKVISITATFFAIGLAACSRGGSEPHRIEDLRILNIRVEPPELPLFMPTASGDLGLDAMALPPPNLELVKVTVLAAHPDLNATFSFDWIQCQPGLRSIPCEGDQRVRLDETPSDVLNFSPVKLVLSGLAPVKPGMDMGGQMPSGMGGGPSLGGGLTENPLDLLGGLRLKINVEVKVEDSKIAVDTPVLEGMKRFVLFEPRLVAQTIRLARDIDGSVIPEIEGLELPNLCTETTDAQLEVLFEYLKSRKPNQSPFIQSVAVSILKRTETATRTVTSTSVITLVPGDELEITPRLLEGIDEKYQVIDGNCELQDFQERPSFSWFTTSGDLRRTRSVFDAPENVFIAPDAAVLTKDDTPVRIFMVIRDGRGGSDHRVLNLNILR